MTQVPMDDTSLPHAEQRHELLAFLSGRFNTQQARWYVLEKEAYAVLATLQRMHWLAATPAGFDLFTDHNNLFYLFDPLSIVPDMSQTTLRKVLRWAVWLSAYNYTCIHIRGTENVWADLLGRWSPPPAIRHLIRIPALPSAAADDYEWPTVHEIETAQTETTQTRDQNLVKSDGIWQTSSGSIWIPDDYSDLQLRLCIIAHTSSAGHRGASTTEHILLKSFTW